MALKLGRGHVEEIRRHGAREYPNECCGVLLGLSGEAGKEVSEVLPLHNLRHDPDRAQEILPLDEPEKESERNRFLIDPLEQLRVEKDARARGLEVMGYYHSHPDHPARPSQYDREHAWPWYSYVIVSVVRGQASHVTCWSFTEDRSRFEEEPVEVRQP
jgi:proteasome lid subunit RPN8/RPN11